QRSTRLPGRRHIFASLFPISTWGLESAALREGLDQVRGLHCWLPPPVQAHSWILVPLAVPAPLASRHSPDWTPVMVPLAFTFHCWLVPPWQSQMIAAVPLLVPAPKASRHLLPSTRHSRDRGERA